MEFHAPKEVDLGITLDAEFMIIGFSERPDMTKGLAEDCGLFVDHKMSSWSTTAPLLVGSFVLPRTALNHLFA